MKYICGFALSVGAKSKDNLIKILREVKIMPFCQNCGKEADADTKFCNSCGKEIKPSGNPVNSVPVNGSSNPPFVEAHLAKAIIVTLVCCLPLGVVSIVQASSVSGKLMAGDIQGAQEASRKADSWANWAIGLGISFYIIYFIFIGVASSL